MRHFLRLMLILSTVCCAFSQSPPPLYSLAGLVQDPSGAGVQGAKMNLRRAGDTGGRATTTDETGAFRFDNVPPGNYEVEVQQEGFKPALSRVRIGSRAPAPLKVVLSLAELHQQVTVDAAAAQVNTESAENLDTVTMDRQALENLPVFDQDFVGTISRFLNAGSVATGGVTLIVDGLESNRVPVSASAIQEVKINQNPYSAEFSRPGRGRIEIITKPGSQEYHGAINFLLRDYRLNARDPFAVTRPEEQRRIFEGSLTGPLGRSKTRSFLISATRQEQDLQAVIFGIGPAGTIRENAPTPQRNTEFSASVSQQIGESHLISWRGLYSDRTAQNQGVGGFTLPEGGANFEGREDEFFFNHRGLFKPHLLNEFRILLFGRQRAETKSLNSGPKITVPDAFTAGGAQADRVQTENHVSFNEVLTWSSGKHQIKTGINVPDISRRGLNDYTNFGGTYSFATLQDYLENRPYSFVQQQGEAHVVFWEKVIGGFVQDDIRLRPGLSLSAGLRYDWQNYFHDNNNFSPRLSFAFAPGQSRKTVLRGGAGFFYDRTGTGPIFDILRYDGRHLSQYVITNPTYPFVPAPGAPQPTSVVRLDPTVQIPYTAQYGIGVERQLQKGTTLTVSYFGIRGVSLFRSRDVNAPPPPFYLARPNPNLSVLRQIESSADLENHSLEVALRGRATRFFNGMVQYTLSRAYNDVGGGNPNLNRMTGINSFPANYDLSGEWARAEFDQRHRFNMLATITPPGKFFNLGVALAIYSGAPYSITTGRDDNHDGLANDRPPGVPRNTLVGPGYAGLDLRWYRDFFLASSRKDKGPTVTTALDAFNVLNRVNYTGFVGNLSSPFFGQAVSALPSRRLQVSLRLRF
jgi:hypothetical protein